MSEEYSGFDLTMYNLFTLLREMYYTRGETETSFLQKSGGTITGSVTIQGNLVVNGQSYSIDTEKLRVEDYTITLAKDNEQTLTSMVGMVVPKYDGTNYGFFGWDADGYAYVGDLTNYDGTSAITLANNSSLQRISTIDTTNTVVASNGVIYVYDATSHCFKKPTNDNKYYVIRNGAFVETELFTEQKSKNIDNALYNVGAFDTISGNTINRQTGYVILNGSEDWQQQTYGVYLSNALITNEITNIKDNYGINWGTSWSESSNLGYLAGNNPRTLNIQFGTATNDLATWKQYLSQHPLQIQYKLATSYPENIIENQPLLNLDSNGCNFLREEWEKGLNLFATTLVQGYRDGSDGSLHINGSNALCTNPNLIAVKPNTTYAFSMTYTKSNTRFEGLIEYSSNGTYIKHTSIQSTDTSLTITVGSTTHFIGINYYNENDVAPSQITNIMLNSGTHPYPYQEYNGEILHGKNMYEHDIYIVDVDRDFILTCAININDNTQFTWDTFKSYVANNSGILPVNSFIKIDSKNMGVNRIIVSSGTVYAYGYNFTDGTILNASNITSIWNNLLTGPNYQFADTVKKLN